MKGRSRPRLGWQSDTRRADLPTSFAYQGHGNAAIGGSSDPEGHPSGFDTMVLQGRGGYTKLENGKLIKGSYYGANTAPYRGNTMGNYTPWAVNGQRIGYAGPSGWEATRALGGQAPNQGAYDWAPQNPVGPLPGPYAGSVGRTRMRRRTGTTGTELM